MLKHYPQYEYLLAAAQLVLAMLGMGATLGLADFRNLSRRPAGMLLSLAAQMVLSPLLALGVARLFDLPLAVSVGMVLVAAMPSGSLSNVFTHLARGNGALSIATTTVATLACLLTTPLVLRIFAAADLPADFQMPVGRVAFEIGVCLLLPLAAGMMLARFTASDAVRNAFSRWCLRGSLAVLLMIVIGALGSGRLDLKAFGWQAPVAIVLFAAISYLAVWGLARALRVTTPDAGAAALTVLLRNCNLAVLIKAALFPAAAQAESARADGVLFAVLFYGGASLILALAPVLYQRQQYGRLAAQPASVPQSNLGPAPR